MEVRWGWVWVVVRVLVGWFVGVCVRVWAAVCVPGLGCEACLLAYIEPVGRMTSWRARCLDWRAVLGVWWGGVGWVHGRLQPGASLACLLR